MDHGDDRGKHITTSTSTSIVESIMPSKKDTRTDQNKDWGNNNDIVILKRGECGTGPIFTNEWRVVPLHPSP